MLVLRRVTLFMLSLAIAAAFALAVPRAALAHAAFVGASPEAGVRTEIAPSEVTLSFTEPLNARLTSVELISIDSGRRVAVKATTAGSSSRLVLRPEQVLGTGAYRVDWHTVSTEDGHALEGSFSFGVRAAAAGAGHAIEQSPLARSGWLRVLLRSLLYASALMFVAALTVPLLIRRGPSWLVPSALGASEALHGVRRREQAMIEALGWLAAGAAVAVTLAEGADAAGSLAPDGLRDYLLSNMAGGARLSVALLLVAAASLWRRFPRSSAVLAALAMGAIAVSGHANSVSPRAPSVLNDWLHLLSGSVWLGGIGLIALIWAWPLRSATRSLRMDVAREVLVPFGRVALPAFLLVSATGLLNLISQLGHFEALWTTGYGRLLAAKILIVASIAAASAIHALRLRPRLSSGEGHHAARRERRHWQLIRAEPALGIGVVVAVGFLVAFPLPPRQLGDADEARGATAACDPCPLPKPAADELPIATQAGSRLVSAWIRRTPEAVTGTLRVRDLRDRAVRGRLRISEASQSSCGDGCWRFRAHPALGTIRATLSERGREHTAVLPARWRADSNARARRLLRAAQATMRRVDSFRQVEEVTSGPGSFARTEFRLRAPDRMAYRTDRGAASVVVGKRQWFKAGWGAWQVREYGSGLAFRTRSWFRWTTYGRSVRLLGVETQGGRRVATLALFDEGTPVWFRLRIDLATNRVLAEQMTAKGHFMNTRYHAFNEPVRISKPTVRP